MYDSQVVEEISKLLQFGKKPNTELIGQHWKQHAKIAPIISVDFTNETNELLAHIENELKNTEAFRPVFEAKSIDSINNNAIISADELATINSKLQSIVNMHEKYLSVMSEMQHQAPDMISKLIKDRGRFILEKTEDFVGRKWVMEEFDKFISNNTNGYFFIKGQPGIGKSAIAAQMVNERALVHHFNIRSESSNTTRDFYQNVCAQLIAHYKLGHDSISEDETRNADFLATLIKEVSENSNDPIVIVVDALDEVDQKERKAAVNILNLPDTLPKKLYIVATLRTDSNVNLPVNPAKEEPMEKEITHDSKENIYDIEKYLEKKVKLPGIMEFIASQKLRVNSFNEESFIKLLKEKSAGNFMYLRYMLNDIAAGKFKNKDLDSIPKGLESYYERHWQLMNQIDEKGMEEYKIPVLSALTVSPEPIPIDMISEFSKIKERHKIRKVLNEWAQFLYKQTFNVGGTEEERYRLYHASFYDFIHSRNDVADGRVDLDLAAKNMIETFYQDE